MPTTVLYRLKMGEINIKEKVLRELRSKHTLSELNSKQRQELQMFCGKWADIFINLVLIIGLFPCEEKIAQKGSKEIRTPKYLRMSAL